MTYDDWIVDVFERQTDDDQSVFEQRREQAPEFCKHCHRLFLNSRPIASKYSETRIASVFYRLPSIDGYLGILSLPELPIVDRYNLARSQRNLFEDLFHPSALSVTSFMWWEHLPGASWADGPSVDTDRELCNVIIQTCDEIAHSSNFNCVKSALHGFNEIGPYGTPGLADDCIHRLLKDGKLDAELTAYAHQILQGQAQ